MAKNELHDFLCDKSRFNTAPVTKLSEDDSNEQFLIRNIKYGINFDNYAKKFGKKFSVCRPASCDALFRFSEKNTRGEESFLFVEFKNGNILQRQQKDYRFLEVKHDMANEIRKKLYDSALMMCLDARLSLAWFQEHFSVLIVVNAEKLIEAEEIEESECSDEISFSRNPVEESLVTNIIGFKLGVQNFIAERIYDSCEVVDQKRFEEDWLPGIEDPMS